MKQGWDDYEKAADKGPFSLALKVMIGLFALTIIGGVGAYALGWFGEAGQVAREEFGPRASLRKYEWFKDAAQQLQKKKADIEVYESRLKSMEESYKGATRAGWAREDREQYNVWQSEVAGVKASFNALAADYNAAAQKVNWRAMNTENLPSEFTAYVTQ